MTPSGDMAVLVAEVRQVALCRTGHPAQAAAVLMQAAAEIVCITLPPARAAGLMVEAITEGLMFAEAPGPEGRA